jgi:hypothetical protein
MEELRGGGRRSPCPSSALEKKKKTLREGPRMGNFSKGSWDDLYLGKNFKPFSAFITRKRSIGTSTLVPVKNEPALTCLNSVRRAR